MYLSCLFYSYEEKEGRKGNKKDLFPGYLAVTLGTKFWNKLTVENILGTVLVVRHSLSKTDGKRKEKKSQEVCLAKYYLKDQRNNM